MTLRHVLKASVKITRFLVWVDHMHYSNHRTDKYRRQDRSQVRCKRIESKREGGDVQIRQQVRSLTSRWAASTFSAFQLLIMKYLESINNHEPRQESKRREKE